MVQGFQHVNEERAGGVPADEELVGQDDGMEPWSIAIHLGLHQRLVFCRVKQKLRHHGLYEFFARCKLACGVL